MASRVVDPMNERSRGSIIITGASRGIGAATAIQAANAGYDVCVNYHRRNDTAASVMGKIRAGGRRAIAVAADESDPADVKMLFDRTEAELGPVTALVNNAAILEGHTDLTDLDAARLERVLAVNVTGSLLCAREAVARMAATDDGRGGAIVNVTSVAAKTDAPHEYIDYAMSRGALDAMTVGLAREAAPLGIRVNTVRSGFIHTDMHADGGEAERVERLESRIPLQRGGKPEEVARAILWLLSDDAGYAVGAVIDVAGGV